MPEILITSEYCHVQIILNVYSRSDHDSAVVIRMMLEDTKFLEKLPGIAITHRT